MRRLNLAKSVFAFSVDEWSVLSTQKPRPSFDILTILGFMSTAHNPEVAGSSPASATIRKASLSQGSEASFFMLKIDNSRRKNWCQLDAAEPRLTISAIFPRRRPVGVRSASGRHVVGDDGDVAGGSRKIVNCSSSSVMSVLTDSFGRILTLTPSLFALHIPPFLFVLFK